MHFEDGASRLSGIEAAPNDNNDSIIHQLNLLENGFEQKVLRIESFLYAQEPPASPHQRLKDSYLHDLQGQPITPISSKRLPSQLHPFPQHHMPSTRNMGIKGQEKRQQKKSIREEIMQENLLLERRLTNKHYATAFPTQQTLVVTEAIKEKGKQGNQLGSDGVGRLEEQYSRSKVVKLYNFILREVPHCGHCEGLRMHLAKEGSDVSFKCKACDDDGHPLMGILYDLENKGRFEEETSAFQAALDGIVSELTALQQTCRQLQVLRDKITLLKNLNRKKYKQINESKFYLRKHLGNLQQTHLIQLQRLIPREYLQQLDIWSDIQQHHSSHLAGPASPLSRIMPVYLQPAPPSRLLEGLRRLLNYEKQQAVKISVSEAMQFPLKRVEYAVFVVDGSYSLPVFEDVRQLQLEFQNKKTLRELNLLFSSLPRQVHSLIFTYNHKAHSHISAETFPFLRFLAPLPALQKLHATIHNVKDFADVLELAGSITPKAELQLTVTKHLFSKATLTLPLQYYRTLLARLGNSTTKIQIDLPQSADSPAQLDYSQILSFPYLCSFRISRGDKQSKSKAKVLQALEDQGEEQKQLLVKQAVTSRANCIRTVRRLSQLRMGKTAIESVLMFLL